MVRIQFTHLLCFARASGRLRVGVGADPDAMADLGSTLPDVAAKKLEYLQLPKLFSVGYLHKFYIGLYSKKPQS